MFISLEKQLTFICYYKIRIAIKRGYNRSRLWVMWPRWILLCWPFLLYLSFNYNRKRWNSIDRNIDWIQHLLKTLDFVLSTVKIFQSVILQYIINISYYLYLPTKPENMIFSDLNFLNVLIKSYTTNRVLIAF